ncbi:hypothetical protein [Nonomuraea wenchangensis]|uniref:hypothetical protein n=1 Tax=Nonomuraea wenchangensis TaxID=568860 RepID=UPI00331D2B45
MTDLDLPVHPRTGLQAIGLRRNGKPIWPVLGGSGDGGDDAAADDDASSDDTDADVKDDADADSVDDAGQDDKPDDDKPLGPAGEKALQAEKERRRVAERQRRQLAREMEEMRAELDKLRTAPRKPAGSADDAGEEAPDLDAIRREAEEKAKAEVRAEVIKERVSDKIEVLAAKRFQNADDAVVNLLRTNEINDFLDGDKIDAEAIKEALDELLEKKPYLAVPAQSETRRFKGSGDGGAKPIKPTRPRSLGEAVSRKLSTS